MSDDTIATPPAGLDNEATDYWKRTAPALQRWGLLTDEGRADLEWMARLHARIVALTTRSHPGDVQVGKDRRVSNGHAWWESFSSSNIDTDARLRGGSK